MTLQQTTRKVFFLTLFLSQIYTGSTAQTAEDAIKNTIEQLFTGMREADSALVHQTLAPVARFLVVVDTDSLTSLRETPIDRFLNSVGTPHGEVWDERAQSYLIRIDGNLATAWTPYRFYLGDKFSHCGVDAFQLYRSRQGWKIIQLTYTRRQEDCFP